MNSPKEENRNSQSSRPGGLFDFIEQTNVIGNVIAAAASQKNSFEPLPFSNSSLFEENYDESCLNINVNPYLDQKRIFLPKVTTTVSITAERKHGAHIFHPYNYTLTFTHGPFKWQVIRTYKDIKECHRILTKLVKQDLGRSCSDIPKEDYKPDWPLFPNEHDNLISSEMIDERCKNLADYLNKMLTYPPFRDHTSTLQLLGVSPLSFVRGIGSSHIECLIPKRTGDNVYYGHFSQIKLCCEQLKFRFTKRWFILKDTYIVYTNTKLNNLVGFSMMVDRAFRCETKIKAGAYHAIEIRNLQRSLILKFKNSSQQKQWFDKITHCLSTTARCFSDDSLLPNGSYAPVRKNQLCKWYVNSAQYMEHVMNGLNNAKEEIFITDWWLSPELFLKRPSEDLQYRLDKILLKKAREGVKVYVMLFKEVSFAIGLLSYRVKNLLTQKGTNPNIKVLRHPEHSPSGVFLWSHHEKMVVIDQSVAFFGGIDLCFGRWDDDLHRLVDLGRRENNTELDPPSYEENSPNIAQMVNEIRDSKERGVDVESQNDETKKVEIVQPDDKSGPTSKPDALIVAALMGNSIAKFKAKNRLKSQLSAPANASPVFQSDIPSNTASLMSRGSLKSKSFNAGHKNERIEMNPISFNDIKVDTEEKLDKNLPIDLENVDEIEFSKKERVRRKLTQLKKTMKRKGHNPLNRLKRRSPDSDSDSYSDYSDTSDEEAKKSFTEEINEYPSISNEGYYWIGKDYCNSYKADFKDVSQFSQDQFDRATTPRMPWRDEGLVVIGEAARDLARHFIQRWNQCKREKVRHNYSYPFLLPKSYEEPFDYDFKDWFKDQLFSCEVQMTRSLDAWSGGLSQTESSILNSYCDLINKSEHFIYIEVS